MKACVTGATGFIGGALARRLLRDGWEVRVLARDAARAGPLKALGARVFVGDLLRPETLGPPLAGVDVLFHAAAHVDVVKPDRAVILRTNVEGTRNILEAARAARVPRVVYLSSVAALGRKHADADESVWHDGEYASVYEETKHKAEQVAFEFGRAGLDIVHVLPCVVIGPGDPKSGAFIRRYLRRAIPAMPNVDGTLSFVHVDDLVDGILLAFGSGRAGERYIFSQVTWTTTHLLEQLERAGGVPPPRRVGVLLLLFLAGLEEARAKLLRRPPKVSREALRVAIRRFGYNSDKARRELGWKPHDFETRFRDTVRYWKDKEARRAAT